MSIVSLEMNWGSQRKRSHEFVDVSLFLDHKQTFYSHIIKLDNCMNIINKDLEDRIKKLIRNYKYNGKTNEQVLMEG